LQNILNKLTRSGKKKQVQFADAPEEIIYDPSGDELSLLEKVTSMPVNQYVSYQPTLLTAAYLGDYAMTMVGMYGGVAISKELHSEPTESRS